MQEIIIVMLIVVSRGNNLELNQGWLFDQTSVLIISKWHNFILIQNRGNMPTQINS